MDEVAALPSPAVVLSVRLDRYYCRLRLPAGRRPFPLTGYKTARSDGTAAVGPARASTVPVVPFRTFRALYAEEFLAAAIQGLHRFHGLRPEGRGSALPYPAHTGTFTARQASLDATDRSVAPPSRASDAGLRPRPFPDEAASLLTGSLTITRAGLTPAGDDELPTRSDHVIVTPPNLCAHSRGLVDFEVAVPRLMPAVR